MVKNLILAVLKSLSMEIFSPKEKEKIAEIKKRK
jgi:hypothetical protein